MRRLSLLCLALLLSGCVASLAEVRQSTTTQVGNFSAPAPVLSYCVLRGIEAIDSPHMAPLLLLLQLNQAPNSSKSNCSPHVPLISLPLP